MVKKRPMGPGRRDLPSPRMILQRHPRRRRRRLLFSTSDTPLPPEKRWWLWTLGVDCCAVQISGTTTSPRHLHHFAVDKQLLPKRHTLPGLCASALIPCSVLDGGTTSQRALSPQTLPALGALSPRRRASRSAAKARLCSRMACELSSAQRHFRSDQDPVGLLESFSAPLSSPRGVTLRCLMVCQQTAACPLSCPGPDRSRIAPHVGCHDGLRLVGSSLSPLPPFPRVQSLLTAAALGRPAGGSGSQCFCLQLSAPSLLMPRPPPPLSSKRLGPCHCTWCSYIRLGAFSSGNHVSTLFRCSVSFLL